MKLCRDHLKIVYLAPHILERHYLLSRGIDAPTQGEVFLAMHQSQFIDRITWTIKDHFSGQRLSELYSFK